MDEPLYKYTVLLNDEITMVFTATGRDFDKKWIRFFNVNLPGIDKEIYRIKSKNVTEMKTEVA